VAKLAGVVDSLDAIDEPLRELYIKGDDGKYVLDADVEGHPAVGGLKSALTKERQDARELKRKLAAAVDPAEVERLRNELVEAQEAAQGKGPKPPDVDAIIKKRMQEYEEQTHKPVVAERDRLAGELRTLQLDDRVRAAALKAGVFPEDVEDVLVITKKHFELGENKKIEVLDDEGDPTGKTPEQWFVDVFKQRRPKFFVGSSASGSGARGNGTGGTGSLAELENLPPAERLTRARALGLK